jgi:DNA-binding NtrC family response regulator
MTHAMLAPADPCSSQTRKTASVDLLVVDDDPELLNALRRRLERLGHAVTLASTVEQALDVLEHSPVRVLLTDLRIGDRMGLDLLEALPTVSPRTRAVLMSGDIEAHERVLALELGATRVLSKPFAVGELEEALRQAFSDCAQPSSCRPCHGS